jgi:hypothetical protein
MQQPMRSIGVIGLGLAIGATWLAHAAGQPQAAAPPAGGAKLPSSELPPGCLEVVSEPGQPIAAVVYDPQQQVLGVYHVDRTTGEIELKSIRQIQWDLRLLHWQGKKPLPEEIKNDLDGVPSR